jgi:hypothetical protein
MAQQPRPSSLYHFRRFDVAWYSAGAHDLSAEKRSAACSSVSDVKAMSPTYVRFANPYKVAGLSTRMRFRVASSHMC